MEKTVLLSWVILILKVNASLSEVAASATQNISIADLVTNGTPKEVEFFKKYADVEAKSGYITVQPGSHLFFLLLKSPQNDENTPLILWLEGGPGKSGLHAQFLKNGPVGIDAEGKLYNRSSTFLNFSDILYVDAPAGGGFSVIERPSVLSTSLNNVTEDLLTFLKKFYALFSEYRNRSLYIGGESYGARMAVSLAQRMERECENHPQGVVLCAGFLIPLEYSILKSDAYMYHLSLLDEKGRAALAQAFQAIENATKVNKTEAALLLAGTVFNFNIGGKASLFANLTGYEDQGSILHTTKPAEIAKFMQYVNSSQFKDELGVQKFVNLDGHRLPIALKLAPGDFFESINTTFVELLETQKVLIVNGQMDNIFPPPLFEEYFRNMNWTGSTEFSSAPRKPWRTLIPQYGLAGYVRESGNLTVALALRAGHLLGLDASEAVYDLVHRFVKGIKHDYEEQFNNQ